MTELDDMLTMRFDESGRDLLLFDLDEEWDGEFPPSLMVHWQGLTWVLVISAEPKLLEVEALPYIDGVGQGVRTLTIRPLI